MSAISEDAPSASLRFGFGTNGFACHRLDDVLTVLADLGYDSVGLTLDHGHLDPYAPDLPRQVDRLARRLDRLGLGVMVETGAPYLLDPWQKHHPTLMSVAGAERRVELLGRAVRIAAELGAPAVHLCSGPAPEGMPEDEAWKRLTAGCEEVLEIAREHGVALGFEPEPYMFVDTVERVLELRRRLGEPELFGVTLDIGHAHCVEELPLLDCVALAAPHLVNVQIEDMRRGVHEHLELGAGEIDFPPVL
ncbi:sugar phosphate isomerase/epimerase family protein, partial [Streptomyces sp. NPDC046909]|uniref:sugar phosphate isomerase/epimerase family protein n=1 Tax=Streptomyces sp. NPDC046909 TaxID=3155617 RepID=UPI0033D1DC11